jgi:hypothetical protein
MRSIVPSAGESDRTEPSPMIGSVSSLAEKWMARLAVQGWCDLTEFPDRFPELTDAIAPPRFSIIINEGAVIQDRDSGYLEASIDARLIGPGVQSPRGRDEEEEGRFGGIELSLDTETRELRLSNIYLPLDAQTVGLGSLVMGQLAVLAEDLGLESIHLEAGNIGRWAWMQCGFDFEEPIGLRVTVAAAQQFAEALGREVDLSTIGHTRDFLALPGTVSAAEMRAAGGPIMPVDLPISLGKALILGPPAAANVWWGRLHLGLRSGGRVRLAKYVATHGNTD